MGEELAMELESDRVHMSVVGRRKDELRLV